MSVDEEVWKPINGWDSYEISNWGRMRRSTPYRTTRVGRILKPFPLHGYPAVRVRKDGKRKTLVLHCVVAETFIGPRPQGYQVNHKDGVKANCRSTNLEYATPRENTQHAIQHGLMDIEAQTERMRAISRAYWQRSGGKSPVPVDRRPWGEKNGTHLHPETLPRGSAHAKSILDEEKVAAVKRLIQTGAQLIDIAEDYGVSVSTISNIKRDKVWRHVPWPS